MDFFGMHTVHDHRTRNIPTGELSKKDKRKYLWEGMFAPLHGNLLSGSLLLDKNEQQPTSSDVEERHNIQPCNWIGPIVHAADRHNKRRGWREKCTKLEIADHSLKVVIVIQTMLLKQLILSLKCMPFSVQEKLTTSLGHSFAVLWSQSSLWFLDGALQQWNEKELWVQTKPQRP